MCASGRSFRLSLRILVNHALQASTVTAAAGQFLAGLEDDDIFATIDGYQFLNLPHIHDGGAVDADEEIRVQPFGDTADSFPKEIRLFPDIQAYVIRRSFNPVNFVQIQEYNPSFGSNHQTPFRLRSGAGFRSHSG